MDFTNRISPWFWENSVNKKEGKMEIEEIKKLFEKATSHIDSDEQWAAIKELEGTYLSIIRTLLKRVEELIVERDKWCEQSKKEQQDRADLRKQMEELQTELNEGDYWQERATEFLQNGNCPICFATDEEGHKQLCPWGRLETDLKLNAAMLARKDCEIKNLTKLLKGDTYKE